MAKRILVTGANGNLGVAVVRNFLEKGDYIIAAGRGFDNLAFARRNERYEEHIVNLAEEKSITDCLGQVIAKHQTVDAAFFLAGGFAMGKVQDTSAGMIKEMLAINFETAYEMSRAVFKQMLAAGSGRIVFIGSRPALEAKSGKNMIAYALSKSLLFKLAECMNEEGKEKNVVTAVIVPSTIDTPQNRESMPGANTNNWVKPAKIAELLEFIISEKSEDLREMVYKIYGRS